ncbi:MAG: MFS transporter [Gammaproteobacteria bacterium]|nr:MAG: MFS transporter [Gammaproteobacteria bacterium]
MPPMTNSTTPKCTTSTRSASQRQVAGLKSMPHSRSRARGAQPSGILHSVDGAGNTPATPELDDLPAPRCPLGGAGGDWRATKMNRSGHDRLILLFGLVTYGMGQSLLYVIFGPLAREIGLAEWQFGVLIAASNVAIVLCSPAWGRASERAGRKPIYLLGLVGFAVGYAALALGIDAGLRGWLAPAPLFLVLLGARLVYGVLAAAIQPAATAYVADTTDAASRGQGMALIAASGGIGTVIGPAFGGLLAEFGALLPMYAAAALALLAAALTQWQLAEPARHADRGPAMRLRIFDRRVFPYLLGWFVIFMVFTGIQVVTPFFIEDRFGVSGREAITRAAMFALLSMGLVTLVVQIVVMQLFRLSPRLLLRSGFLLFAGVLLLLASAGSLPQLYALYAAMGLAVALATPGLNAAASLAVAPGEQGAVAGLLAAAPAFGMIFGPALGGSLYNLAPALPMLSGAVLTALVGLYFFFVAIPSPAATASESA